LARAEQVNAPAKAIGDSGKYANCLAQGDKLQLYGEKVRK